jgi:hypothetical protein
LDELGDYSGDDHNRRIDVLDLGDRKHLRHLLLRAFRLAGRKGPSLDPARPSSSLIATGRPASN